MLKIWKVKTKIGLKVTKNMDSNESVTVKILYKHLCKKRRLEKRCGGSVTLKPIKLYVLKKSSWRDGCNFKFTLFQWISLSLFVYVSEIRLRVEYLNYIRTHTETTKVRLDRRGVARKSSGLTKWGVCLADELF